MITRITRKNEKRAPIARLPLCLSAALLLATSGMAAQSTIAIRGATIVPVSGPRIANGTVVITGDRITAVGANVAVPAGA